MKKVYVLSLVLLAAGLFTTCKKKTLPEAEQGNDPVFYFNGNVNGTPYVLQAGVNNYYMFSGYNQNASTGVYGFSGTLKQNNCSGCINSIQIEINDYRYSSLNGPSGADSAFNATFYPFCAGTWAAVSHSVTFYPIFNNMPTSYLWDFGDGSTSTVALGSHIYAHPGNYNVSLTVTDNQSCGNTVTNLQSIGPTDNLCQTTITVTGTSTMNPVYTHSTIGSGNYTFHWDFGDGNTSTSSSPTHSYTASGRYPVSLQVVDILNKDTAVANLNYAAGTTSCTTNYFKLSDTTFVNGNGVSNVIVKWTDSNGTLYTSNDAAQPSTSYFKILSSSNYHENELGQKTKRLHVKFKCVVYSATSSMTIENADAVIVVAYK